MSWASLANNQCVSQANLQDAIATSVFTLKNAFGSTNQEITTANAENWVYINPIGKPANRLVVKSDLVSAPPSYYIPLYFSATEIGSCTSTTLVYGYYDGSPLGVASYLYTDATLTVGLPNGYYWYDYNTTYQIDDVVSPGQIIAITSPCIAFPTWTWTDNTNGGGVFQIFVNSVLAVQQFGAGNTGLYSGSYSASIGDNVSASVTSYGNPSTGTEAILYIENPNGTIIFNSGSSTSLPNISQSISHSFTQAATSVVNGFSNNV